MPPRLSSPSRAPLYLPWTIPCRCRSVTLSRRLYNSTSGPSFKVPLVNNNSPGPSPFPPKIVKKAFIDKIYMKNLPRGSTPDSVKQFLDEIGVDFVDVAMRKVPDIEPLAYFQWAMVTFPSPSEATQFFDRYSRSPSVLGGKTIWYSRPKMDNVLSTDQLSPQSDALFVGNLPFDVDPVEVWDCFDKEGTVKWVIGGKRQDIRRGFVHIHFTDMATPESILHSHMNGNPFYLGTRQLRLDYAASNGHHSLVFEGFTGDAKMLERSLFQWKKGRKGRGWSHIECLPEPNATTTHGRIVFTSVDLASAALQNIYDDLAESDHQGTFRFKKIWDNGDWKGKMGHWVIDRETCMGIREKRERRGVNIPQEVEETWDGHKP